MPDPNAAQQAQTLPYASSDATPTPPKLPARREIGGRDGPDPTRYGDWEKNGRCIDF